MSRKPRLCIIAHSHPDFSKGGGEVAAYRQFLTQRAAGWEVVFVAASEVNTGYAALHRIEPIMRHAEDEYLYDYAGMEEDRLSWRDAGRRRMLVRFLAGLQADVYHFHHYWRVGADLMLEVMEARPEARIVLTAHEMLAICLNHGQMITTKGELCRREAPTRCLACFPDQPLEELAMRKAYLLPVLRRMHHVIYPSEFIRRRYEDWGLRGQAASVLENYLGDEMTSRPRQPASRAGASLRFGFFGQPTPFKGLDVLLSGFSLARRQQPDMALTVFGATREDVLRFFPTLRRTLDEVGSAVFFTGRYDPADVLELMHTVGWIVVPSIWWENSPVVIQEARRAGTPMIVSNIGGMAEKVRDGVDGLHFRRASVVDLADVMLEAARPETHSRLCASLGDSIGRDAFLQGLQAAYTLVESA